MGVGIAVGATVGTEVGTVVGSAVLSGELVGSGVRTAVGTWVGIVVGTDWVEVTTTAVLVATEVGVFRVVTVGAGAREGVEGDTGVGSEPLKLQAPRASTAPPQATSLIQRTLGYLTGRVPVEDRAWSGAPVVDSLVAEES